MEGGEEAVREGLRVRWGRTASSVELNAWLGVKMRRRR